MPSELVHQITNKKANQDKNDTSYKRKSFRCDDELTHGGWNVHSSQIYKKY